LLLFCLLLHCKSVMSGYLSTWVGLLSNEVGLFRERGFSKVPPPPSLSSHLSSSLMGVFSRDYGQQTICFIVESLQTSFFRGTSQDLILYSRKIWWALNLVILAKILYPLNLAIRSFNQKMTQP